MSIVENPDGLPIIIKVQPDQVVAPNEVLAVLGAEGDEAVGISGPAAAWPISSRSAVFCSLPPRALIWML